MSRITVTTDMTQCKPEELAKFLDHFCQNVEQVINGRLDFSTNLNCKLISITFSTANLSVPLDHGLGRVPAGYIVTSASAATSVYDSPVANTTSTINLMASAPATVGLLVF